MIKLVYIVTAVLAHSAYAQYTGSYSERNRQLRENEWAQEKAADIARTQQDNAAMLSAAGAYARFRGTELTRDNIQCKTRRDIYWYGFNPPRDDDAWGAIRYNYCEFNVGGEGCSIGMSYANKPILIGCIAGNGTKNWWSVTSDGRVSPYREGASELKRTRRR